MSANVGRYRLISGYGESSPRAVREPQVESACEPLLAIRWRVNVASTEARRFRRSRPNSGAVSARWWRGRVSNPCQSTKIHALTRENSGGGGNRTRHKHFSFLLVRWCLPSSAHLFHRSPPCRSLPQMSGILSHFCAFESRRGRDQIVARSQISVTSAPEGPAGDQ